MSSESTLSKSNIRLEWERDIRFGNRIDERPLFLMFIGEYLPATSVSAMICCDGYSSGLLTAALTWV